MSNEYLKTYDVKGIELEVASRENVHKYGHWHEVFSCWVISKENNTTYIYLQLRSGGKNDYPNLLDITVAGHLMHNETVEDGVREIKEELGISINFKDLIPLGTEKYSLRDKGFLDNEINRIFLCRIDNLFNIIEFNEEVYGIIKVRLEDMLNLWNNDKKSIPVEDCKIIYDQDRITTCNRLHKEKFLPYGDNFYKSVLNKIKNLSLKTI